MFDQVSGSLGPAKWTHTTNHHTWEGEADFGGRRVAEGLLPSTFLF